MRDEDKTKKQLLDELAALRQRIIELETPKYTLSEEAFRKNGAVIQTLLESASNGIVVMKADGRIVLVNAKVEELFGYDREELLGQFVEILVPVQFRQVHVKHRTNYLSQPGPRPMGTNRDLIGQRKDGTEFPIEIGLGYVESGDETFVMSFIVDITERKRTELALQESEEKYRSLFKYANDSIFIVDPATRRFLDVNENAARRLGYTREELLQLMVDDIAAPTTVDYIEPTLHKLFETGNIIFEHVHQRKDGSPMPVEISSRIIQYGDRQVIQSVVRDLTERKRIEAARQRELRSLEQLSGPPQAGGTGETFDLIPLRQTQPDTFAALVERYGDLMDFALEERGYKIKHNISEGLRAIVEHLGSLRAGPRDVVEIHITALREKSKGVSALKTEAYTEEGRLMVLELMGYLVAYFRNHSLGIEPMSASDSHNESGGAL